MRDMSENKPGYVKISGVNPQMKEDLELISKSLGVTTSSFLKPKLREIINEFKSKKQF